LATAVPVVGGNYRERVEMAREISKRLRRLRPEKLRVLLRTWPKAGRATLVLHM